jgi:hypothetical protein
MSRPPLHVHDIFTIHCGVKARRITENVFSQGHMQQPVFTNTWTTASTIVAPHVAFHRFGNEAPGSPHGRDVTWPWQQCRQRRSNCARSQVWSSHRRQQPAAFQRRLASRQAVHPLRALPPTQNNVASQSTRPTPSWTLQRQAARGSMFHVIRATACCVRKRHGRPTRLRPNDLWRT